MKVTILLISAFVALSAADELPVIGAPLNGAPLNAAPFAPGAELRGYIPDPRPVYTNQQQYTQNQPQNAEVQGISAVDASRQLIAAAVAQGANPNNFGIQTNAHFTIANQANPQIPPVWDALDALRGRAALSIEEILNILAYAIAGKDYPIYNDIPNTRFNCENVKQAGFYADTDAQCQVIRRCDINGVLWSYLCPNMTLFNQITLVCDWFFNVNCNYAAQYYDYSNPRLYTQFELLDTPNRTPRPTPYPSNSYPAPVPVPAPVRPYPAPRPVPASGYRQNQ